MKQRVLLTGSDAIDLLHRISTVNLQTLALNEKIPALFLNSQGKILCFFLVTRKEAHSLEIEFDENFLEVLDQYTFAERYQIENLSPPSQYETNEPERIEKMIPKFGHEFKNDGTTNPLEVNLRSAIHDNKGCYPGQEVIEKIISLGSPQKTVPIERFVIRKTSGSSFDPATQAEVGLLTSVAGDHALAIIKRTHLKQNLSLQTKESHFTIERIS